ncbi:MAG: SCO family protein [Janthinobacterium lividum]
MFLKILPFAALLALAGCGSGASPEASAADGAVVTMDTPTETPTVLPYAGNTERRAVPGHDSVTAHEALPAFDLPDQDGHRITNKTLAGKVYITDFFFATCPGICPKMQSELLKVYKQYSQDPRVVFVSHSIDPEHDSLPVLRDYARRLGVGTPGSHWRFVRPASRPAAYGLAQAYFTAAQTDLKAPGGIAHGGTLALVDDQGYVRGTYDGLSDAETARLLRELPVLLKETETRQGSK